MALDIKANLRKNRGLWIFALAALLVAIILGVFVSPYASKSPDGLDKTARDKGFAGKAENAKPLWKNAPLKDYVVPGVKSEKVSTGLSGLMGVLLTLAVALATGLLIYGVGRLKGGRKKDGEEARASAT